MSKLVKVTALAAFVSGGREIMPGPAQVPADAVQRLTAKQLIEPLPDGEGATDFPAAGNEDIGNLRRERDELLARVAQLEAELSAAKQSGDAVLTFAQALHDEFGEKDAATVLASEYSAPDVIIQASDKELDALQGFGEAKVAKLRELAEKFTSAE